MQGIIASKVAKRATFIVRKRVIGAALLPVLLGWASPVLAQTAQPPQQQQETARTAEETTQIRCLLPAAIERYGTQLTIVGARQEIETSPAECAEQGGEVVDDGESSSEAELSAQPEGVIR